MQSLNRIEIIGNTTAAPEVKETPNGTKVATFSVATNRTWKDSAGVKQEAVDFHNVVAWGNLAEILEKYLEKGKKVFVAGRSSTRSWDRDLYEENEGKFEKKTIKIYKTEIVAENVILLSSKSSGDGGEGYQDDAPEFDQERPKPKKKSSAQPIEEINIEDIPF